MTTVFIISSQKLIACHVANMACPFLIHVFVDSVSQNSVWMHGTYVESSEVNIDDSKSLSDIHPTSPWKLANSISSYNKFLVLVPRCLPSSQIVYQVIFSYFIQLNKTEQIFRNYIPNCSYQGLAENELETYEEEGDISSRTDNVDGKNLATSRNNLFHHGPIPRNLFLQVTCVTE